MPFNTRKSKIFCNPLDLPGIVSGNKIGFLDPHKTCFGNNQSGKQYRINGELLENKFRDQFKPFQGVFDFDFGKNYESTLFRFPLRTCPSKLSQTEYSKDRVYNLFNSLREEAPIILLFMKHVQHISVYERIDDEVKCIFKVEVAPEMCETVKEKRQTMLQNAVEQPLTESSYAVKVSLTTESETEKHYEWLVLNQIGLEDRDERIVELSDTLSLLPWIGCAIPLNENAAEENTGRIFCYLPLPRDVDCQIGLPFLVHGAFGVTENRSGLLWPGSECQNNETAEWNVLLVEKVLSSVIYSALKAIITDNPVTGLTETLRRKLVYSTVPKLKNVKGHWNCLPNPLFQMLKKINLFHAKSSSNTSWITIQEGLFDQTGKAGISGKTRDAVFKTLLENSQLIITDVPDHVREFVERPNFGERQDITPEFFRNFLRKISINKASPDVKLLLLDYILDDNPQAEALDGIPLLPLASGQFVTFSQHRHDSDPSSSVFVPRDSCTEALLPNMEDRFLKKDVLKEAYGKLNAMAVDVLDQVNPTQLITLTSDLVIECLRSNPHEWFREVFHQHPEWLNVIWQWMIDAFETLERFEGVPLIPLESSSEKKLGDLSKNSRFIFDSVSSESMQLPSEIVGLLEAAGCTVLERTSDFLHVRHPDISSYIISPVPAKITLLLGKSSMEAAKRYIRNCSKEGRKVVQKFFVPSQPLSEEEKSILRCLPLLDKLDGTYSAALESGQPLSVASPKFQLPDGFNFRKANQIISCFEVESQQLVRFLDLKPIDPADIFSQFLFPDIELGSVYSREETSSIMLWILERKCEIENQRFLEEMKKLSFVNTKSGKLKRPRELYDPNDSMVADLFLGEDDKFPSEEFCKLIQTLKELGLKAKEMITPSDLLDVAAKIHMSDYQDALKKVQAMVKIFQENPEHLQTIMVGIPFVSKLSELKWLPRATGYPPDTGYPSLMQNEWYKSEELFYRPGELFRELHSLLVGTSAPILGIKMNDSIQNSLGIQKKICNASKVVEHLKKTIDFFEDEKTVEKRRSSPQFTDMLKRIYLCLSEMPSSDVSDAISRNGLVKWIWHGSGFCSPDKVALEKDLPFDFRPPLYLLPETLNENEKLIAFFKSHGVRDHFSKDDIILVLASIKDKHEDTSHEIPSKDMQKDLKFCRSVLEWLVKDGPLTASLRRKVFVPVHNPDDKLVLKECEKCTYCDQDWLKHDKTEDDIPDDIHLIHGDIPSKLSPLLGVPSLSSCLLSSESVEFEFEQAGPNEPITTRIGNILKEYKEGIGIFKELIQNADDAGASTVKFLIDRRQGRTDKLFSREMSNSQGPALWAYNDAVFTDKDFENINKLAGGTKVEDLSKIGRFGLGFNAVYHLTDVPSFISRNYLCIFDPNVNHIPNHVRDRSQPGIRVDLAKNSRPLKAFADQFSLYHDVFGCKTALNGGEKFNYPGTLFRFSFRTKEEAEKSEICKTVYDFSKVKDIVHILQRSASLLLLFTQNIKHVELHELCPTGYPQDTTLVLSISKEMLNVQMSVPPYIKQCSDWWKNNSNEAPSALELVKIEETENPSTITDTETSVNKHCTWLVAYCVGRDTSIKFASGEGKEHGLLPLAGAAALLQSSTNDIPLSLKFTAEKIEGEAFCFLPLSISTALPIHVNASFAVRSNRDGIWEKTTTEENLESRWNDSLLQDAIPEAYFKILAEMIDLSKRDSLLQFDQRFHDFWPRHDNCRASWRTLVSHFYTKLIQRHMKLFYSNGEWMGIAEGLILDDELRKREDDRVMKTLQVLGKHVFNLPSDVISAMKNSVSGSVAEVLQKQTVSLLSFFKSHLFPNLSSIPPDLRNPIVHDGLRYIFHESREDWEQLKDLYQNTKCIPCSPDGKILARPCDLIDPRDEDIAVLYSREENRFPTGELDYSQMCALEKLGMAKDLLSWKEIYGRAKSIEQLANDDKDSALRRSQFLTKYLRRNIERLKEKEDISYSCSLPGIKFLPVLRIPPPSYTLPWKGAEFPAVEFRSSNELFLPNDDTLVGSSCLILDTGSKNGCGDMQVLENLLGFSNRRPSCKQVLRQLEITRESTASVEMKFKVCKRVYRHLDNELTKNTDASVVEKLRQSRWLFLDGEFVENRKIALEWKGNASPFLHRIPEEYKREFAELLKLTGIKKVFTASDFLEALDALRKEEKESSLTQEDIDLVVTLIKELKCFTSHDVVKKRFGAIPLPDGQGILCDSGDLTIPESFRVKYEGSERYIHSEINQNIALKLGAKQLRDRRREKYGSAMHVSYESFGQFEKLTDRIRNILVSYPCDVGILKELVQNADDAKATEIHFIYDKRTLSHKRVLQNDAEEIQGPALCVYNNKHFSEDDFKGICKLGIGSKHDDPAKTGQYGIGFNAVYHLTDCPSFLSNNNTMCILDPHCKYVPEATHEAPGGRYNNIDHDFRDVFSDTVSGYLGDFPDNFPLKGATMFRLPLRTEKQAKRSEISRKPVTHKDMVALVKKFKDEAKKVLLFLNHVKKIGLWEITEQSELQNMYTVSLQLEGKYQEKLNELYHHLQTHKDVATSKISVKETTYTISIQDDQLKEEWLIHQRLGIETQALADQQIPNVRDLHLFPRAGIAMLLSSNRARNDNAYVAYCFLPLPVTTYLPVHVNGHFALDGSRRDLWYDTTEVSQKTRWNNFMKRHVCGPAYASSIIKAKEYLPNCENDLEKTYISREDARKALDWYHNLFPDPEADPKWKILAIALYQCVEECEVLPVVSPLPGIIETGEGKKSEYASSKSPFAANQRKCKEPAVGSGLFRNAQSKYFYHPKFQESARESNSEQVKAARYNVVAERRAEIPTKYEIEWLRPSLVYFTDEKDRDELESLFASLLNIRMPILLFTPMRIHKALIASEVPAKLLTPENVIEFLLTSQHETSRCDIGKLPIQLGESKIQNEISLRSIVDYCEKTLKESPSYLEGLPLLLTADDMLRAFTSESPVYCTSYSYLFPSKYFMFVHPEFVVLFSQFFGLEPRIILDLSFESLATVFMPDVFDKKLSLSESKHLPWDYPESGILSKEWFSRLWKLLQWLVRGKYPILICEDKTKMLVQCLGKFPIIPTTDGKLATVNNAKTVLALAGEEGNFLQKEVIKILKSLSCPFLDTSLTKDGSLIAFRLVANPRSQADVLRVLQYMNSTGILNMSKCDDKNIKSLLKFFQLDWQNNDSIDIAKNLPLYKGVDGKYHSLRLYGSCIQVPLGLPVDGIKELQGIYANIHLFLPQEPDLRQLYKALKIKVGCKVSQFYIDYVLPQFSLLSQKCQIAFLDNMRYSTTKDLIEKLKSTSCIPDQHGTLRCASDYCNPHDELFKVMLKLEDNVFPAAPYNEEKWINFLVKIGLKENCDEQHFIKFSRRVQESARNMSSYHQELVDQSKALVKYLLQNGTTWSCTVLSEIEFVCPDEVEIELSSLYPQCHANGKLEFVSYRNSVPWKDRHLVWTSYKLLPDWAHPNYGHHLASFLLSKTPLESVIKHVQIMSKCASDILMSEEDQKKITEVFNAVYDFFKKIMGKCPENPPFQNCRNECREIERCLKSVACIPLFKERRMISGERLSFEDPNEKLKPHFYVVPRELVHYEHLLKKLGVTEKMSASQMAIVLKSIKDSCSETMNSKEEDQASYATSILFNSLHGDSTEVESRLANCEKINLPSMKKRLVNSKELVCKVQSRLCESVEKQGFDILYPLEKCGLKRELEDAYINSLPKRLRPTPLSGKVREELDPFCKRLLTCSYCEKMDCPFIQKFILVLRSSQFERGILRLLKHQKETSDLDEQDRARAARFTSTKVSYFLF